MKIYVLALFLFTSFTLTAQFHYADELSRFTEEVSWKSLELKGRVARIEQRYRPASIGSLPLAKRVPNEYITSYLFNGEGLCVRIEGKSWSCGKDTTVGGRTYEYQNGKLIRSLEFLPEKQDSAKLELAYDNRGYLLNKRCYHKALGQSEWIYQWLYSYDTDKKGRVVKQVVTTPEDDKCEEGGKNHQDLKEPTLYAYDSKGKVVSVDYGSLGFATYKYKKGKLVEAKMKGGVELAFKYNKQGDEVEMRILGERNVNPSYQEQKSISDKLSWRVDDSFVVNFVAQCKAKKDDIGKEVVFTGYEYDAQGNWIRKVAVSMFWGTIEVTDQKIEYVSEK